jgi:hypothetical protein
VPHLVGVLAHRVVELLQRLDLGVRLGVREHLLHVLVEQHLAQGLLVATARLCQQELVPLFEQPLVALLARGLAQNVLLELLAQEARTGEDHGLDVRPVRAERAHHELVGLLHELVQRLVVRLGTCLALARNGHVEVRLDERERLVHETDVHRAGAEQHTHHVTARADAAGHALVQALQRHGVPLVLDERELAALIEVHRLEGACLGDGSDADLRILRECCALNAR